ncbi:MAG: hypothetical protein QOG64_1374 [Acidimicrobiaceae bacterium]|jgi:hypothetical protein|nr:hypothetical protein [Acidimicrobiaceae bacterium]
MSNGRWAQIASDLTAAAEQRPFTRTLCVACRDILVVTGAAITLVTDTDRQQQCASNAVSATLEDLQYTLGEGPSLDASRLRTPIAEGDLMGPHQTRWPALGRAGVDLGVCAVFAYPLQVGVARIGVLTLYQDRPGLLTPAQETDALVVADLVGSAILAIQARAAPDTLALELADAGTSRAEVHQASGMISVQLAVTIAEALVRLRAHAYATGRPLAEVAADVVGRQLRFDS